MRNAASAILFGTMFTTAISQSFVFAILPGVGREVGLTDMRIGVLSSAPALLYVLSAPILGSAAEKYGQVRFLQVGLLSGVITNIAFGVVLSLAVQGLIESDATFALLLLSRLVLNLAWGGMLPAAQSYVAQNTSVVRRLGGMALLAGSSGLGLVAGPVIPWALAEFSSSVSFFAVAALTVVPLVLTPLLPALDAEKTGKEAAHSGRKIGLTEVGSFFVCAFLVMFVLTSLQQLAAFQIQDIFLQSGPDSSRRAGQVLSTMAATMLVAQWSIASARLKLEIHFLIILGGAIGLLSVLAIMASMHRIDVGLLFFGFGCLGLAVGLILPANTAGLSLAVPSDMQGRMAGFLGSAQGAGRVAGPLLGTYLYGLSVSGPSWLVAGCFLAILLIGVVRRQSRQF